MHHNFFDERVHHNSFIGKKIACSYKAYGTTTATNATFSLVHKSEHEPANGDFRVRSFKAKLKP